MKKSMLSEYANDAPPVGMSHLLRLKGFNLDDLPFTHSSSQLQLQIYNFFLFLKCSSSTLLVFNDPSAYENGCVLIYMRERWRLIRLTSRFREDLVQSPVQSVWVARQRPAGSDACGLNSKQLLPFLVVCLPPPTNLPSLTMQKKISPRSETAKIYRIRTTSMLGNTHASCNPILTQQWCVQALNLAVIPAAPAAVQQGFRQS